MNRNAIPWLVAAVAVLVSISSVVGFRSRLTSGGSSASAPDPRDEEVARLRRRVASMESEAGMLRAELDRMTELLRMKRATQEHDAATGDDKVSDDERRVRLAKALTRLKDLAPQLRTVAPGDTKVLEGLRDVFHDMLKAPLDDPTPFKKAYAEADDPLTKQMLVMHIVGRDPEGAKAFLLQEIARTQDPELKADLVAHLGLVKGGLEDPAAQKVFFSAIQPDQAPRARQAAVQALVQIASPQAQEALMQVASSEPDEATREEAIRALAKSPEMRSKLLELVGSDPSERVRTLGECTAKLAALNEPQG